MPAHTDVCNADFGYLSATNFNGFASVEVDHVDSLRGSLGNRLNNHVIIDAVVNLVIEQVQLTAILANEDVFEGRLANLALQILPNVGVDDRGLLTVALTLEPVLEAAQANGAHRSHTLARCDELVFRKLFLREADPANLVFRAIEGLVHRAVFAIAFVHFLNTQVMLLHVEGVVGRGVHSDHVVHSSFCASPRVLLCLLRNTHFIQVTFMHRVYLERSLLRGSTFLSKSDL